MPDLPVFRTTSVDGSRSLSASRKSCGTVSQDFEQLRLKEVKVTQVHRLLATAFAEVRYLLRWSNPARERVTGTPFFKEFRRVHSYNFVFRIRSLLAAFFVLPDRAPSFFHTRCALFRVAVNRVSRLRLFLCDFAAVFQKSGSFCQDLPLSRIESRLLQRPAVGSWRQVRYLYPDVSAIS